MGSNNGAPDVAAPAPRAPIAVDGDAVLHRGPSDVPPSPAHHHHQNHAGPSSTSTSLVASGVLLVGLLVACLLLFSFKHTDVVVRVLAPDPRCSVCSNMIHRIDILRAAKEDALLAARRDVAAKRAVTASILGTVCPEADLKGTVTGVQKGAAASSQKDTGSSSSGSSGATGGSKSNESLCADVVAGNKRALILRILNASAHSSSSAAQTICHEYCEASMGFVSRGLVTVLRFGDHPSVVAVRTVVEDVWGSVLILGAVATLLAMILQARVRASRLRYAAALKRKKIDAARTAPSSQPPPVVTKGR